MQLLIGPRVFLLAATLAACSRPTPSRFADLASKLPADAVVIAGADLDRLRSTPLFANLPQPFRDGSYAVAAFSGSGIVTATRQRGGIAIAGRAGSGAPDDLVKLAPDAPLWIVARGSATLPLTGNLANLNRLLHETEYTVVGATAGDRVELRAEATCRSDADAQRVEENVRAIGSLTRFPLDVVRDGVKVRVTASVAPEAIGKLF